MDGDVKSVVLYMKNVLSVILVILWMIVIFINSNTPGNDSGQNSRVVTSTIFSNRVNEDDIANYDYYIRKWAHIIEYLTLSVLIYNVFYVFGLKNIKYFINCVIVCMYAITDEVHQLFVVGRSGMASDVVIDMIGYIIATVIVLFIDYLLRRLKDEKRTKEC